jgi:hypothetical protein
MNSLGSAIVMVLIPMVGASYDGHGNSKCNYTTAPSEWEDNFFTTSDRYPGG